MVALAWVTPATRAALLGAYTHAARNGFDPSSSRGTAPPGIASRAMSARLSGSTGLARERGMRYAPNSRRYPLGSSGSAKAHLSNDCRAGRIPLASKTNGVLVLAVLAEFKKFKVISFR